MVCDCCDGFHPGTGRCVHDCGLVRDYKKDLDVFQKLGLMPGATMPARALFDRLLACIPAVRAVCAYGDGVVTSREWNICGSAVTGDGYAKAREAGIFGKPRSLNSWNR
ncbi:MAG: hypothetical protein GXP31_00630 [Kiritimatiellaeota bacterium]|nr:hypothetical protein [Kiritimatiellota bacterium]